MSQYVSTKIWSCHEYHIVRLCNPHTSRKMFIFWTMCIFCKKTNIFDVCISHLFNTGAKERRIIGIIKSVTIPCGSRFHGILVIITQEPRYLMVEIKSWVTGVSIWNDANWDPILFLTPNCQLTSNLMPINIKSDANWLPNWMPIDIHQMLINTQPDTKNVTGYQRNLMKMRADHATSLWYIYYYN